jgi:GTP cyclohydrolase I
MEIRVVAKDPVRQMDFNGLEVLSTGRLPSKDQVAVMGQLMKRMFEVMGLNIDADPNLVETPERFAKALLELMHGIYDTNERLADLMKVFPSDYDEMIVKRGVVVTGMCPHHLQQIRYRIAVGYLPDKDQHRVIGLSKIARVCDLLAARPIMQEQLSKEIAEVFQRYLHPQGVGVVVVGEHGCVTGRGVEQHEADMVTASMTGVFRDDARVRSEFLAYAAPPPK